MQVSNASTKHKHQTQALNASIKHKYQTLPLMGATRLASGKRCSFYLVDSFIIPTRDASPPLVLEFVLAFSACV